MTWEQIAFEAVKLFAQAGFALFIAWRAVKWALGRYKAEKHWERKLGAYSDVVMAMGTLLNVLAAWEDQEITERGPRGITPEEQRTAYWSARRKLEEAQSVAMLLLSPPVAERIKTLVQGLARIDDADHYTSFVDKIDDEWNLITAARDGIVGIGRKELGLAP